MEDYLELALYLFHVRFTEDLPWRVRDLGFMLVGK